MEDWLLVGVYLLPLLLIIAFYVGRQRRQQAASMSIKAEAIESGLTEPVSLHPVIDPQKCIGCGSCVSACPEQRILGLINNKAELIAPAHCIGHGACRAACPENAITLVFGTAKRGVEIPELSPEFETSVKGIYIAGELGGMGLIRNAIEQSTQAMAALSKKWLKAANRHEDALDVLIVGAGPAGITAALYATEHQLRYKVLEQDSLGGTVAHFPRGKVVMTAPAKLPLVGQVKFTETSKEELLSFWQAIEQKYQLDIHYHERMSALEKTGELFKVSTSKGVYLARTVLLTIGRRGTPRTLGVPGEELAKVAYRLLDAAQFHHQKVLVVGGGDSAIEAATSIAEQSNAQVVLSYRGAVFDRIKQKNRARIDAAQAAGRIHVLLQSEVRRIETKQVQLKVGEVMRTIENDAVLVCIGGILPTSFLKTIGIEVATKYGTA